MNDPWQMQLIHRLHQHACDRGDARAFIDAATGDAISWSQLHHRVNALRKQLQDRHSDFLNQVVLIRLPNCCEFAVAFLGVLAAGMTAFPVSIESPAAELEEIAKRSSATILIGEAPENFPVAVIEIQNTPALRYAEEPGHSPRGPALWNTSEPACSEMHTALMLLSSGSTGAPKVVCRSFASIDAVCDQMCRAIGITSDDRVLATVPLCHSYGIEHGLLAPVWAGATVHLVRGLDLPLIQRELQRSRITLLPAVPSVYEMLANLSSDGERYPGLRAAYSAGAPLPLSVANRFHDRCGVKIGQVFGATEIGSVTYSDPQHPHFNSISVGQPMSGVKIKIADDELWISAASMFSGYLDRSASQVVQSFYPTGDLARLDGNGNLVITGRTRLLIDIGGLKVNPLEVEHVLLQHPSVSDCIVVPVPQSETVVRLKAIIIARDADNPPAVEDLRYFSRQRLAGFKVPRLFELRASLPRTQTGKILRQQVQA